MTLDAPLDDEVASYTLAIMDLNDVAEVARLVADEDPDFKYVRRMNEIGRDAAIEEARGSQRPIGPLGDPSLRLMIETGLVVTYARPFTKGIGSGFPLDSDRFVPAERRDLHEEMINLRNKVHGHIDKSAPEGFNREIRYHADAHGQEHAETRGPRLLGEAELRHVANLADEIVGRLEEARRAAHGNPLR